MNELSPQARALLARTASADDPTDADRARVLGLIGTAIAVPPVFDAGASAGAGAGAAAGGGTLKLVIAFVVSVGVGGGLTTVATRRTPRPPPPAVVVAAPPVQAASARAAEPEPVAVPEPAPEPAAPVVVERRAPPPPPVPKPQPPPATPEVPSAGPRPQVVRDEACELSAELAVVQRAQRALGGAAGEAVGVLDAFAARCANGSLVEERLATRALALCLDGKAAEGKAAARELADRFPASPSLSRVTQTCGQ